MKKFLIIILFFLSQIFHTQKCNCENHPELKRIISCKPQVFKNNAKVFWQYNCDSSWLIFQNNHIKKKLFSLEKDLISLTNRIGYSNIEEYKHSFLVEYRVISGCCQSPEYILHNKNNGNVIKKLGIILYKDQTKNNTPFILTLKSLTTILFTDLNTNKINNFYLKKGMLEKIMLQNNYLSTDNIFDKIEMQNNIILLHYKIFNKKKQPKKKTIKINTEKFY